MTASVPITAYFGDTHTGRARPVNEDNFYTPSPAEQAAAQQQGYLFLVADGIGGNRGGKRASQVAVEQIPRYYYGSQNGDTSNTLSTAIQAAGRLIASEAGSNPDLANMGCTLAAAAVKNGSAVIAHLGDARVYLLRGGQLQQITKDHTWVQEQVEHRTLTEEEARNHPNRNVITKSLGTGNLPAPTLQNVPLQNGDKLLLCSDGLCGVATEAEMTVVLQRQRDPRKAIEELINLANHKGGPDNIAAVVVQVGEPAAGAVGGGGRRSPLTFIFLPILAIAVLWIIFSSFGNSNGAASPTERATPEGPIAAVTVDEGTSTATVGPTSTLRPGETVVVEEATAALAESPEASTTSSAVATHSTPIVPAPTATPQVIVPPPTTVFVILSPQCGQTNTYQINGGIQFKWTWNGTLGSSEYLEIRTGSHGGDLSSRGIVPDPTGGSLDGPVINYALNGTGDYQWQIAYMKSESDEVKREILVSDRGCFTVEGGGSTNPSDRDGDGVSDNEDVCDDVPAGPNPDPAQPGCPTPP